MDKLRAKLFYDNGTIKKSNMLLLIALVFIIAFALIYVLFYKDTKITEDYTRKISTAPEATYKTCSDCTLNFLYEESELLSSSEYFVKDLINYSGMSFRSIDYKFSEKGYAELTIDKKDELVLKTLNKVGKVKLTATFEKYTTTTTLIIVPSEIKAAALAKHEYFFYLNEVSNLELVTDPENVDVSNFDVRFEDTNIVDFDENKKVVPKQLGDTKVFLTFDGETTEQKVHVLSSKLDIKCNIRGRETECYNVNFLDLKNNELDLVINISNTFKSEDIRFNVQDNGITCNVSFDGTNVNEVSSYFYKVKFTKVDDIGSNAVIEFSLPDGSKKIVTITREEKKSI